MTRRYDALTAHGDRLFAAGAPKAAGALYREAERLVLSWASEPEA